LPVSQCLVAAAILNLKSKHNQETGEKMSTITIHAGDFAKGAGSGLGWGGLQLRRQRNKFGCELISLKELQTVEIATEESVKKVGGTVGWGTAGAVLLGPAGMLAGLLLGGKKKEVTFVAEFKDGRKFMGTTDSKSYTKIKAATFK
jgi:hypothetical protein